MLQYQHLHWIINNSHVLILPEARCANLASRVLALNLKRLSADWERGCRVGSWPARRALLAWLVRCFYGFDVVVPTSVTDQTGMAFYTMILLCCRGYYAAARP